MKIRANESQIFLVRVLFEGFFRVKITAKSRRVGDLETSRSFNRNAAAFEHRRSSSALRHLY